jgi:hypothetical protein
MTLFSRSHVSLPDKEFLRGEKSIKLIQAFSEDTFERHFKHLRTKEF